MTGKRVYTLIGDAPKTSDVEGREFLQGVSKDTAFLKENGITIVHTQSGSQNLGLAEVRKNVYLLKEVEDPK